MHGTPRTSLVRLPRGGYPEPDRACCAAMMLTRRASTTRTTPLYENNSTIKTIDCQWRGVNFIEKYTIYFVHTAKIR